MAGRKAKPTALKIVMGNPGKRAIPTNLPEPTGELDQCPDFVSEEARAHWDYVTGLIQAIPGVSKRPDETTAALMCQAIADFMEASKVLKENGGNYQDVETKVGGIMTRIHPGVAVRKSAMDQILKICVEFGMTPSSRTRLRTDLNADKKNPNDKYFVKKA